MRAPTNPNTAPHANETPVHLADKIELAHLFEKFDFDYVLFEHCHSDVVGVRCGITSPKITAGELQESPRNVVRNIERNFRQGAVGTVVVCRDFAVMAAVAKVARSLPPSLRPHVGLTNMTTLQLLKPRGGK